MTISASEAGGEDTEPTAEEDNDEDLFAVRHFWIHFVKLSNLKISSKLTGDRIRNEIEISDWPTE